MAPRRDNGNPSPADRVIESIAPGRDIPSSRRFADTLDERVQYDGVTLAALRAITELETRLEALELDAKLRP